MHTIDYRTEWESAHIVTSDGHYIINGLDVYCRGFGFVRVHGAQGLVTCRRCGAIALRVSKQILGPQEIA